MAEQGKLLIPLHQLKELVTDQAVDAALQAQVIHLTVRKFD